MKDTDSGAITDTRLGEMSKEMVTNDLQEAKKSCLLKTSGYEANPARK